MGRALVSCLRTRPRIRLVKARWHFGCDAMAEGERRRRWLWNNHVYFGVGVKVDTGCQYCMLRTA